MTRAEKMAKARKALGGFVIVGWDEPDDVMTAEEFRALLSEAIAPMTCETCRLWCFDGAGGRRRCANNRAGNIYDRVTGPDFGCVHHEPKEETT